jgi:hypothetical protein
MIVFNGSPKLRLQWSKAYNKARKIIPKEVVEEVENNCYIEVSVASNGCYLSKEQLENIVNNFDGYIVIYKRNVHTILHEYAPRYLRHGRNINESNYEEAETKVSEIIKEWKVNR